MYNKWHNTVQPCSLGDKIPDHISHIIVDCKVTKITWKRIERVLLNIIPSKVTDTEELLVYSQEDRKKQKLPYLEIGLDFSLRHRNA